MSFKPDGPETVGAPARLLTPDGKLSINVCRAPVVRLTTEIRPVFGASLVPASATRKDVCPAVIIFLGLFKPVVKTDVPCAIAATAPSKIV